MSQVIGQYRFVSKDACMTKLTSEAKYQSSTVSLIGSDATSDDTSFRDVVVTTSTQFVRNTDYYMKVTIPQDVNYTNVFSVKLVKTPAGSAAANDGEVYQFLRSLSVSKGGQIDNSHLVALYGLGDGTASKAETVKAMCPIDYAEFANGNKVVNGLYYKKEDGKQAKYYLYDGKTLKLWTRYNDMIMQASWNQQAGTNSLDFELVFRPVENGFSKVVFEMSRQAIDYNIEQTDKDGNSFFGRVIDLDAFSCEIYSLSNLVKDGISEGVDELSRIGVTGHSGLLMAVNGEEIRVGASGRYELDVLPVSSLGIVAQGYQDNFSIDYTYEGK